MKKVGNYTLVSELGKGQFGVVYKAHNTTTDEVFAIKSITKQSVMSSPKLKELFDTEVKIMASIKHPNIMHLYELLETNNNYYLVLDYCRSGDMETYVKRHKGLGEEEAVYLLMQVMNGFKELHKNKIMHRDFKLANIFLDGDRAVIGDFGFAKSGTEMAQTKLGSPITMAPEILLNKGGRLIYTNKADLWSIGVCFFEMIFGNEPWPNVKSVEDLCQKVQLYSGSKLLFPQNTKFKISPECKELLINLIELNPQQRISWEGFYNHRLFLLHQQRKAGANDMMKSIMFRNNKDNVYQQFNVNKMDKAADIELHMDPAQLAQLATGPITKVYSAPTKIQRSKDRIVDRYTHEKKIMVFLIQTSVRMRNLSKDKANLAAAGDGLMLCGILLLKKAILLNFYSLDSLKRNYNLFGLEDFEQFVNSPDRQRFIEEMEQIDIPTYQKLFGHLLQKIRTEMGVSHPRTAQILKVVEDSTQTNMPAVEDELRKETYYLVDLFSRTYNGLPQGVKVEFLNALAHLYVCSRHKDQLPFLQDGLPFDWNLFEKSWEGAAGIDKMNKILNKAHIEK